MVFAKEELEYLHLNPDKKGLVKRPEDWRWSSCNNFALDKATVAACPIQIDYVSVSLGYRAWEKPTQKITDRGYGYNCDGVITDEKGRRSERY